MLSLNVENGKLWHAQLKLQNLIFDFMHCSRKCMYQSKKRKKSRFVDFDVKNVKVMTCKVLETIQSVLSCKCKY